MEIFEKSLALPVSAQEAFRWHERPGALQRLIPPWENVRVARPGNGIENGSVVELVQRLGPLRFRWVAEHDQYDFGHHFRDTQRSGPFASWQHWHRFTEGSVNACVLTDHVEYQLPGGSLGRRLAGKPIRERIAAMFRYRHQTTHDDLSAHARYRHQGSQHVAVTGSSGMLGATLCPLLTTGGHRVTRLVRGSSRESGQAVSWDPHADTMDVSRLAGIDAVVHLAGENIAASRWTSRSKQRIRDSRVVGTRTLCTGLARMPQPPRVLISASAVGYYGDRGDAWLTEEAAAGTGFLPQVAEEWEEATEPARRAGIRVVQLRFGMILSSRGGALAKMLLPFQLGCGGRVGSGQQYWSWIAIDDAAGAIHHALFNDILSGPVNAVAPQPVTNAEFTRILGTVLRRPTVIPVPAPAARAMLGEMADELLLASVRVEPRQLSRSGYVFRQPTLETALRHLLGRTHDTSTPAARITEPQHA